MYSYWNVTGFPILYTYAQESDVDSADSKHINTTNTNSDNNTFGFICGEKRHVIFDINLKE